MGLLSVLCTGVHIRSFSPHSFMSHHRPRLLPPVNCVLIMKMASIDFRSGFCDWYVYVRLNGARHSAALLSARILCCCLSHTFWCIAVYTRSGVLVFTSVLAYYCLHMFWRTAVYTYFELLLFTHILACCCLHTFWFSFFHVKSSKLLAVRVASSRVSNSPWV